MTTPAPRLTNADAALVAALTESSGRPTPLRDLVHDLDWLNRGIPSYDELSFGIPRLVASGYALVSATPTGELLFASTTEALRLRRSTKRHAAAAILEALRSQVGPSEDRSLGRLPGLTPQAFDAAVAAHASWVGRWSRPLVAAARLLAKRQRRQP
jgi:hypothetical protein